MKPNAEIMLVIGIFTFVTIFLAVPVGFAIRGMWQLGRNRHWLDVLMIAMILSLFLSLLMGAIVIGMLRYYT